MAVVLAVLGLASGGREVRAAETTISAAEAGDHHCKCKACRGASSCCCAHSAHVPATVPAKRSKLAPSSGKAPLTRDSRPCVGSAPCGGGESTPASPAGVAVGKIARLNTSADLRPPAADQKLVLGTPAGLPQWIPSRLDEPPEVASRS